MKVFLSYSSTRGKTGRQLRAALEAKGIEAGDAPGPEPTPA